MSKPTIVCAPGPCQPMDIYFPLQSALSAHGYTTIPISLPSIGTTPPTDDFNNDVVAIRTLIMSLVEDSQDVILVMQGFTGVSGSQALHGLGKLERGRWGLSGGVIRLIFIMGWIVKEGFQAAPRGEVANMFHYMIVDPLNGISTIDPTLATSTFYNDLPPSEAEYWKSKLQSQSLGVFWSETTYAAWRYIPSTYVFCGKDRCVTEEYAKMILDAAKGDGRHMIDTVERCEEAGYCPMLGQVEWTVDMLRRAAGEANV